MSKPTKEIIELSKKIYGLGYRQKIERGCWYIGRNEYAILWNKDNPITVDDQAYCLGRIPIPSLEDGLLWLKKSGWRIFIYRYELKELIIGISNDETDKYFEWKYYKDEIEEYEAVLMVVIKVLEMKNK